MAIQFGYQNMVVSEITRRHIKYILSGLTGIAPKTYNKFRSYLMSIFKELLELECVEYNPVTDISRRKETLKVRQTLSMRERKAVNDHLKANYYEFWRFIQIFFHSGARPIELMLLKVKDVNLDDQTYKITVKKGREYVEQKRVIKDVAVPFIRELIRHAHRDHFIFSHGLVPGPKNIDRGNITRRWKMHVKDKLGITADLYSLKHSNLDEVAEALDLEAASRLAGHKSTIITMRHYATGEKSRQENRIKKIANEF